MNDAPGGNQCAAIAAHVGFINLGPFLAFAFYRLTSAFECRFNRSTQHPLL